MQWRARMPRMSMMKGEHAVACKVAEQSNLSTDAKESEDAEEEAEEMLDVNALN